MSLMPTGEKLMTQDKFNTPAKTIRLVSGLCVLSLLFGYTATSVAAEYREHDIATLQALMEQGELSSRQLTQYYLDRIEAVDRNGPTLNSIIEVNPDAIEIAEAATHRDPEATPAEMVRALSGFEIGEDARPPGDISTADLRSYVAVLILRLTSLAARS